MSHQPYRYKVELDLLQNTTKQELKNNKVIVWSKKISNPKFVRYGWKCYFEPNFFNKEGLPASSFSTINEF